MRDWEMAEHFAERDGVRMSSGQHIDIPGETPIPAEMVGRWDSLVGKLRAAEARCRILEEEAEMERNARREAERKLDSQWFMHARAADVRIRAAEARVKEAEADSMEQAQIVARLGAQVDSLTARAEQAERERDGWRSAYEQEAEVGRVRGERMLTAEARVAALKAALRDAHHALTWAIGEAMAWADDELNTADLTRACEANVAARAALGEQEDE